MTRDSALSSVVILVSLQVLRHTVAVNLSNMFYTSRIRNDPYGEAIHTVILRSKLECMSKCSVTETCRSAVFDPANMACTANRWSQDLSGVVCGTGTDCSGFSIIYYGVKVMKTTMRQECRLNFDCVDPYSECRDNQCLCEAGYSYDGNIYQCVASCTSYGDTFQPDAGMVLSFNNQAFLPNVGSEDCLSYCVSWTSFVCKTVEVYPGECYLQDYTKLDRPDLYTAVSGYILYTRDCL